MLGILVVDDCPDSVMTLQLLLQSWGHETLIAADGFQTLKRAELIELDVVILDIGMPGMDGYEAAKRLRQLDPQKPIIIALSGYCTDADVRRSLNAGFTAHLSKPVATEDIRKVLVICEKCLHWNPPAQSEDGSRPTVSLPARRSLEE